MKLNFVRHKLLLLLFSSLLLLLNIGCNNKQNYNTDYIDEYSLEDSYEDGTYCAKVEYYNPSTGTRNTYDLDVEVENGELTLIHWSNGGWLDNSHFIPEDITSGECEFTSDRGYRYTVTLGEFGGCGYTDEHKIRNDLNDEVEATTCTNCGNEKNEYDDYCYSCKRTIEDQQQNACSNCGAYEYGVYGGLCSNCKEVNEYY